MDGSPYQPYTHLPTATAVVNLVVLAGGSCVGLSLATIGALIVLTTVILVIGTLLYGAHHDDLV